RGLARAIGAEKAKNRAAFDLHRQVTHHYSAAERFGQPVHVDDDVGRRAVDRFGGGGGGAPRDAAGRAGWAVEPGCTPDPSTGCPPRTAPGRSGSASSKNTSFERSSTL